MKTTSAIRFIALAAVLLASANVDASDACYQQGRALNPIPSGNAIQIILCLINLVTTGNISVPEIMKCITQGGNIITPYGEGTFVHFTIKNGAKVTDTGKILNAQLKWGKWQHGGQDVETVNNMEFDSTTPAIFAATGNIASGSEGLFEIHEGGKRVAVVKFNIPLIGSNELVIEPIDKSYVCDDSGFSPGGSPAVKITCYTVTG